MAQQIEIGQKAPGFDLSDQHGKSVSLVDYQGKKVVLFFFPRAGSPVCTGESMHFRDNAAEFEKRGAVVIGISADPVVSQLEFATKNDLAFPLLSDEGQKVRKEYKIRPTFGLIPGRETFVIDENGIIRSKYSNQFNGEAHVKESLKALEAL